TPQDIRARLSNRFRLLTGGRGRHQTLRSTIDWSYDLLPENERALFRRLSVFAGGFDLQAVEAICGDSLDAIERLVNKSLVIVEQLSDERLHYRLLETLRHYAAERLAEAGEEESARERHFTYYLDLAEQAYARRIEDEAASLASLDADHDNFRSALQWARTRPRDLLRLASALGWFWHLRSYYREGRGWLEEAVAAAPNDRSPDTARALWGLSMILNWSGDAGARQLADRSLELWQENSEPLELALARETLAEGRAQNEPKFIHYSLHYLGDCALWRGEPEKAVPIYCDSLRAALDYGNQMEASTEMQGIAMGLAGSGKEQEALRLYGASCARNKELQPT